MNAFDVTVLVALAALSVAAVIYVVSKREGGASRTSTVSNTYLLIPITLFFILMYVAVLRSPSLISSEGIGSAIIVAAPLILATFALTPIALAGRGGVDLSVGPLIGFINVTMIQWLAGNNIESPVLFFLYALGVGIVYQVVMGLIIIYVRIQPIIVALSGFLALAGLNMVILPRPGGVAPEWMYSWGFGEQILSPVLAILVVATFGWFILDRTAFFGHLRMMGSDERAAYTSGVKINTVRLGAHMVAGVYSGLSAITFTALIGSGDPTQGSTYTLMAVTALVLGGTSLAGGRGGVIGSLLGAINIYLITYVLATFSFGMVQSFVTDLAYGLILVVALLLTLLVPKIQASIRISPLLFFVALAIVGVGITLHAQYDYGVGRDAQKIGTDAEVNRNSDVPGDFMFEGYLRSHLDPELASKTKSLAVSISYGTLLVVVILYLLRLTIAQARQRNMTPIFFFVVLSLVASSVYFQSYPHPSGSDIAQDRLEFPNGDDETDNR